MSLRIIKAGILDTIQDTGRFGYQSSGINPGGAMDSFAARLANCLLGKPMNAPVMEMHFPAPAIVFEEASVICITGADFSPVIDNIAIEMNRPVAVNKSTVLQFKKLDEGARCYLSILQHFIISQWLNSYSTNLKAAAGGYKGSALQTGDLLPYKERKSIVIYLQNKSFKLLPFRAACIIKKTNIIEVISGSEWRNLTEESQQIFITQKFAVSAVADRMGYRLQGVPLKAKDEHQLVSSAVNFGTLQLLPNGQLIVLMADHQTTGGYPRVGHVISAHLPLLSQMKPHDTFTFKMVDIETAEQKALQQHHYLLSVQYASQFNIEKILQ